MAQPDVSSSIGVVATAWQANELEWVSRCLVCDSAYLVPMYADLRSHTGGQDGLTGAEIAARVI